MRCNVTQFKTQTSAATHLHDMQRLMPRAVPLVIHRFQKHAGSTICAARIVPLHVLALQERDNASAGMDNVQRYVCAVAYAAIVSAKSYVERRAGRVRWQARQDLQLTVGPQLQHTVLPAPAAAAAAAVGQELCEVCSV
jgi:hypothetical protein